MTARGNGEPEGDRKMEINDEEAFNFLLEQFKQCYIHVRHYQSSSLAIIKFTVAFFSALGTISIAVYKYIFDGLVCFRSSLFFFFLMMIAFSFGSLLFGVFLQLRRTSSRNVKQIIEIRNKIYKIRPKFFDYKKTLGEDISEAEASKPSLHLLFVIFISFINSIILSISAYFLLCTQLKWLFFAFAIMVFPSFIGFFSLINAGLLCIMTHSMIFEHWKGFIIIIVFFLAFGCYVIGAHRYLARDG